MARLKIHGAEVEQVNQNYGPIPRDTSEPALEIPGGTFVISNATPNNTISIIQTADTPSNVATSAALHVNNTDNAGIGLAVYSDQDADAAQPLVHFKADNAAFDQTVLRVETDGNTTGINLLGNLSTGTAPALLNISDANTVGGNQTVKIVSNRGSGVEAVNLDMNGNGRALFIDHDDTSFNPSLEIDRDTNSVGRAVALKIDIDNAGAGGVIAIDLSGMSAGERLLKVPTDNTSIPSAASTGRIAIDDGAGNIRYIPYYT